MIRSKVQSGTVTVVRVDETEELGLDVPKTETELGTYPEPYDEEESIRVAAEYLKDQGLPLDDGDFYLLIDIIGRRHQAARYD